MEAILLFRETVVLRTGHAKNDGAKRERGRERGREREREKERQTKRWRERG